MYYLAQINIARTLAPLDDPLMADFVAQLDEINALADSSPGFIWRSTVAGVPRFQAWRGRQRSLVWEGQGWGIVRLHPSSLLDKRVRTGYTLCYETDHFCKVETPYDTRTVSAIACHPIGLPRCFERRIELCVRVWKNEQCVQIAA